MLVKGSLGCNYLPPSVNIATAICDFWFVYVCVIQADDIMFIGLNDIGPNNGKTVVLQHYFKGECGCQLMHLDR